MPESDRPEPRAYWIRLPDGSEYGPGSLELMATWARDGRVPRTALLVTRDGAPPVPVISNPALLEALDTPPPSALDEIASTIEDSAVGSLVPFRNQPAMVGYWMSIAALIIPGLGAILGPASMALGGVGLYIARRFPKARGTSHSFGAIIIGFVASFIHIAAIIALLIRYADRVKTWLNI
jgi:hypothetical protein